MVSNPGQIRRDVLVYRIKKYEEQLYRRRPSSRKSLNISLLLHGYSIYRVREYLNRSHHDLLECRFIPIAGTVQNDIDADPFYLLIIGPHVVSIRVLIPL